MIFVTVGTHEQPFNRLVQKIDNLKKDNIIEEDVIIQTGFCTYQPKYCTWSKLIPYKQICENIFNARIVITHGGPASFIMPLQIGKIPIVVPRQCIFNEHVNNHQLEFSKAISERMNNIITITNVDELESTIINYDNIINNMNNGINSNNQRFNEDLEKIVNTLFSGGI